MRKVRRKIVTTVAEVEYVDHGEVFSEEIVLLGVPTIAYATKLIKRELGEYGDTVISIKLKEPEECVYEIDLYGFINACYGHGTVTPTETTE